VSDTERPDESLQPTIDPRRSRKKRVRAALGERTMAVLRRTVPLLPYRSLHPLSRDLSSLFQRFSKRQRRITDKNLQLIFGATKTPEEIDALKRAVADHTALMFLEWLWVAGRPDRVKGLIDLERVEMLKGALDAGKGAIIFVGHFGNNELAAARLSLEGLPMVYIIRRRTFATVEKSMAALREGLGVEVIGREEGIRPLMRVLGQNKILGLTADNPAPPDQGQRVTLLGHPCYMWPTAVALSFMTGAPVFPCYSWRGPDGHHTARVMPAFEFTQQGSRNESIAANVEMTMRWLDQQILVDPTQFAWYYDRWYTEEAPDEMPEGLL
jgi:KDO2-lipid IV(A) lauroyltransferase